jgi:hypothetical protein
VAVVGTLEVALDTVAAFAALQIDRCYNACCVNIERALCSVLGFYAARNNKRVSGNAGSR